MTLMTCLLLAAETRPRNGPGSLARFPFIPSGTLSGFFIPGVLAGMSLAEGLLPVHSDPFS